MSSLSIVPNRQVHLDFHTSPDIPDVGAEFDPSEFAQTVEAAGIESITIFAKCHHGMSYYPTKCGIQHPALSGRDLMGEQIEALHKRGIRCPLYITVGWEDESAHRHVDWRQLDRKGQSIRAKPTMGDNELIPGGWHFMNWLHPEYQDLMEAHIRELFSNYDVDGLFFDIVVFDRSGGWSPHAMEFRRTLNLCDENPATFDKFLGAAQKAFTTKFSQLIRDQKPDASIFYNCASVLTTDSRHGIRNREEQQTHFELESLPTGHWGYYHFPRIARFVSQMSRQWIGQTGRFQKSWGDFGGIKPDAALEYECFRSQALGGGVEVGDQLPPRGKFDIEAIDLIGRVFNQIKQAEPFYEGAIPHFDIGIMAAGSAGCDWQKVQRSESGAVLLAQAARRNPVLLDDQSDFEHLPAIILPDDVVVSDRLVERLKGYYEKGGKLIISHRSGFDASGHWRLNFLPFRPLSFSGSKPTYWRTSPTLSAKWAKADRVIYSEGMDIEYEQHVDVLIQRVLPYFQRTDARFCSHFQAPPSKEMDPHPALIASDQFLYFADPVFRDFRQSSQVYVSELWIAALENLMGPPLIKTSLAPSIEVIPCRRNNDLLLTLLRYLPVRKAMEIDVIDERLPFTGEKLVFSTPPAELNYFADNSPVQTTPEGAFSLEGSGRILLSAPDYFKVLKKTPCN